MKQSTLIFSVLLIAFVGYVTLRGDLPAYLSVFTRPKVDGEAKNKDEGEAPNSSAAIEKQVIGITEKDNNWFGSFLG